MVKEWGLYNERRRQGPGYCWPCGPIIRPFLSFYECCGATEKVKLGGRWVGRGWNDLICLQKVWGLFHRKWTTWRLKWLQSSRCHSYPGRNGVTWTKVGTHRLNPVTFWRLSRLYGDMHMWCDRRRRMTCIFWVWVLGWRVVTFIGSGKTLRVRSRFEG